MPKSLPTHGAFALSRSDSSRIASSGDIRAGSSHTSRNEAGRKSAHAIDNYFTAARRVLVSLAVAATFGLAATPLTAQQLTEGFEATTASLPVGVNALTTTTAGTVYFDGFNLILAPAGSPPQTLLTYPVSTFASFSVPIGTASVLFGESSQGGIWSVPLNGQTPQHLAYVPYNYDAVLLDDDRALVSAKTGGWSAPDNDVMFVDLVTGQTQLLAQFPGASGPLATTLNGDIYYATASSAFPAPAGTVSVLRLTRSVIDNAIANNLVLDTSHAQVVIAGLDAASDLAFDDDGDLLFVDWFSSQIGEINDADSAAASLAPPLIDYAGSGLSGSVLQFIKTTTGPQVFEPFQPIGGQLLIHETDYASINQVRSVTSQRPDLIASVSGPIPTGPFTLTTILGPANGIGLLAFATTQPAGPTAIQVPGFEQPLLIDSTLTSTQVLVPVTFNANGDAYLSIVNPGFTPVLHALAQVVTISSLGSLGSSAAVSMQISN